ncbi:hypothetical protein ACIQWZ_39775 [Streptomyces sp. NPDC098077]|uniref:hypothetical protein n=1 Tax=Streptomyces sp. NPDC098077 TaxID=3366093 RepID=UPI00382B815B
MLSKFWAESTPDPAAVCSRSMAVSTEAPMRLGAPGRLAAGAVDPPPVGLGEVGGVEEPVGIQDRSAWLRGVVFLMVVSWKEAHHTGRWTGVSSNLAAW